MKCLVRTNADGLKTTFIEVSTPQSVDKATHVLKLPEAVVTVRVEGLGGGTMVMAIQNHGKVDGEAQERAHEWFDGILQQYEVKRS